MVRLCQISEIDALFTDQQPPEEIQASLREAKISLFVAESAR
jgi:DeoR/GlpR family transcriptional regulator of sugar metabolism